MWRFSVSVFKLFVLILCFPISAPKLEKANIEMGFEATEVLKIHISTVRLPIEVCRSHFAQMKNLNTLCK